MQPPHQMQAWTEDASGIHIGSHQPLPHTPPPLQEYLAADLDYAKKILVAPKGFGKTLFLKYKANLVRQRLRGAIAIFPDDTSDIEFLKLSMEWREMSKVVRRLSENEWSLAWQFVLIGKGVQLVLPDEPADEQLKQTLGKPRTPIGDMLTNVLRAYDNRSLSLVNKLRSLRNQFNESGQAAVIFIDNTDEMFIAADFLDTVRSVATANAGNPINPDSGMDNSSGDALAVSHPVWTAAQVGLMLAVREIERSTRKLSVYTSLRAEAIVGATHNLAQQAMAHTIPIKYSKSDLNKIFEWHVNLMKSSDLVDPESKIATHRLVGKKDIIHTYVKHNGTPLEEDLVDLIIRHTCYSPRELVILGKSVAAMPKPERDAKNRSELIRTQINIAASGLYKSFCANFIPPWPKTIDDVIKTISSAVLSSEALAAIGQDTARKLFAFGLLGYAVPTHAENCFQQVFLNHWDSRFASEDIAVPRSPYYFLHPWLFDYCVHKNTRFLRSTKNIIGDGCKFVPPLLPEISLTRGPKGRPHLTIDGEVIWPKSTSQRLTKPVLFMLISTIAVSREKVSYVEEISFTKAINFFDEKFPEFNNYKPLNPFKYADHRSHLESLVAATFPEMRAELSHLDNLFRFHGGKSDSNHAIEFLFLDPDRVSVLI